MANEEENEEQKCTILKLIRDAVQSPEFKNGLCFINFFLSNYPMAAYFLSLKASMLDRKGECKKLFCICSKMKSMMFNDEVSNFKELQKLRRASECVLDSDVGFSVTSGKFLMNIHQVDGINTQSKYLSGALEKVSNLIARYRYEVRVESSDQHKTAEEMYNLLNQEDFLLWAICVLQLQVVDSHKGSTLSTRLEELLKKHIECHQLKEPKCALLHIYALEQQAKYSEALEIFSKQEGEQKIPEVDKLHIVGRLLARSGDYVKATKVFRKVLQEGRTDDWGCFQSYISCLLEDDSMWLAGNSHHPSKLVDRKPSPLSDEVFDSRILIATQFVKDLIPEADRNGLPMPAGTNDIPRWHHLACLEIECRKILQGRGDDQKLMMDLVKYFERLGHLAWFSSAAMLFLKVLPPTKRREFVGVIIAMCKSMLVMSLGRVCKYTTTFKLLELLGFTFELSVEVLEQNAVKMTRLYAKSRKPSKRLDLQENMHSEELISMTSNVLVQLFWRTQDLGYLFEAITILEHGLTVKRNNSQYKILLVHIYSHIGAISLAYERYKALGNQYILLETMSHHVLPQLSVSPVWSYFSELLNQYHKFREYYLEENTLLVYLGLCNRRFLEVIESVELKKQLKHSLKYLMTELEEYILKLKQNGNIIEMVENVLQDSNFGIKWLELSSVDILNSLSFNEDFQTRPWWTPTPYINYLLAPWVEGSTLGLGDKILKNEPNRIVVVRRSSTPRLVFLSMKSASSVRKALLEAGSYQFSTDNTEFFTLLENFAGSLGLTFDAAVNQIVGMSKGLDCSQVPRSDIVDWMNFAVFWNAWRLSAHGVVERDKWPESWKTLNKVIGRLADQKMGSFDLSSSYDSFSLLVQMVTEPVTWHTLVLKSCARSLLLFSKNKLTLNEILREKEHLQPFYNEVEVIFDSIESMLDMMNSCSKAIRKELKREWSYSTSGNCVCELAISSSFNEKIGKGIKETPCASQKKHLFTHTHLLIPTTFFFLLTDFQKMSLLFDSLSLLFFHIH